MATIHFKETTTSTPERFVVSLTDFGPGRSKVWGNRAGNYLKVHNQGPCEADVTEGSSGIWERLHYDWSDPQPRHHDDDRLQVWETARATLIASTAGPTAGPKQTLSSYVRQEPQGAGARDPARHLRQACSGKEVRKDSKGHRGP